MSLRLRAAVAASSLVLGALGAAAAAAPPEGKGPKSPKPPKTETGCVDIVGRGSTPNLLVRDEPTTLPTGQALDLGGTAQVSFTLADVSCKRADYRLNVFLPDITGGTGTVLVDDPSAGSTTVQGDDVSTTVTITHHVDDLAAITSTVESQYGSCVYITVETLVDDKVIDVAPDEGSDLEPVCIGGSPALSSFK